MSKNIEDILEELKKETGKSLGGIATAIGRKPQVLYDVRDGKVKSISLELATDIIKKYPKINIDFLMTGQGEITSSDPTPKSTHRLRFNAAEKGNPIGEYANKNNRFTELSSGRFEMFTKLVTAKAKAGYLTGWGDDEFIDSLPDHIVTITNTEKGLPKGMYMSFEIDGDSMDYDGRDAIPSRSIVTARQISRSLWNSKLHLSDYKDYIIVCFDGVLCKRIIDHDVINGTITIHSLNPDKETYPDEVIELKHVMQIFNIVKKEITY